MSELRVYRFQELLEPTTLPEQPHSQSFVHKSRDERRRPDDLVLD